MDVPNKLLIGGELVDGAARIGVINPATGQVFAEAPRADASQAEAAIAAARRAFPLWAALPHAIRKAHLEALADRLQAEAASIGRLLTMEQGKPLKDATMEAYGAAAALKAYAAVEVESRTVRDTASDRIVVRRRPIGVVSAILPWNFPLFLLVGKIAPALSAGNTVVAKPAPSTPLTALALAQLAAETLPAGVLNIIVDDNDLGTLLTSHPEVDKVSFTGSTATGRKVMASAASSIKRLTLELGGNDAAIILDDADVSEIAPKIFQSAMVNSGQVCLATKRVYAPAHQYDALCDALADLAGKAIVDDGLAQGVQMGPVQNRMQYGKLEGFLADAHASGTVIAGGAVMDREGYFVPPTIVRDIPDTARLVVEEQFGPVLPVLKYENLDDAIARANDTPYGLGGTIWTSDPARGMAVAERIESGTVWVNKHLDLPFGVPFGGNKQSGFGTDSVEEFTQVSVINAAL